MGRNVSSKIVEALPKGMGRLLTNGVTIKKFALSSALQKRPTQCCLSKSMGSVLAMAHRGHGARQGTSSAPCTSKKYWLMIGSRSKQTLCIIYCSYMSPEGMGLCTVPWLSTWIRLSSLSQKNSTGRIGLPILNVSRMFANLHRKGVLNSPPSCTAVRSKRTMKYPSLKASGFNRYTSRLRSPDTSSSKS